MYCYTNLLIGRCRFILFSHWLMSALALSLLCAVGETGLSIFVLGRGQTMVSAIVRFLCSSCILIQVG